MSTQAEDRLMSAKIRLILNQPFFGNIAPRLIFRERKDIPVAATDGIHFFYNSEAIEKLSTAECEWLIGHEIGHIIFFHFDRMEDRDTNLWNCAADFAINYILKVNKIGRPIANTLYETRFDNMHSEQIYDILASENKTNLDNLVKRIVDTHLPLAKDEEGNARSEEQIESLRNEIKESIISSFQNCQAGESPHGIDRLIKGITEPKLSWKEIIRQSIKSCSKADFTFQRPNKRSFHTGIYLPSMDREEQVEIAIALDMSGSISDDGTKAFLSEVYGIITDFTSWSIRIWSFDCDIYNYKEYSSDNDDDILNYKPKGGGGTSFERNWEFMKKNDISPKLFIMFTDMYPCDGWGDPNYCDTLFVSYGTRGIEAPFGETVYI
jgi:predicted metal-dependent peptidase